jgi:hypothetical protein
MANSVKVEFVGSDSVKKYTSDGVEFNLGDPDSCVQSIPVAKAEQLLADFPKMFKSVGGGGGGVISEMTKDELNDYAAQNYPDVELSARMKKSEMADAIRAAM